MRKLLLALVIVLLLIAAGGFFFYYQAQFIVGRADVTAYSFSVDNSYIFTSPLQAKANNDEKVRVTVVVLNNQGLGVLGQKVSLENAPHLTIVGVQAVTDTYGKAVFDVSSNESGDYYLNVTVGTTTLPQKVKITYY